MRTLQKIVLSFGLFFLLLLLASRSDAQLQSIFTSSKTTLSCPTETIYFQDGSKGSPVSWTWDFGDHTGSTLSNPMHQYSKSGTYTVSLVVKDNLSQSDTSLSTILVLGPSVQYSKIIDTVCGNLSIKFSSKATGGNPLIYTWDFGDGKTSSSINSSVTHIYKGASSYPVSLTVKDTSGCAVKLGETITFGCINPVPPTTANTLLATRECDDQFGWTNYYNDNNTPSNIKDDILLLSIYKNKNSIGKVGDGTFQVKVVATQKAGTSQGILLNAPVITNPSGYYVMNRYWVVQPTTQPASPVGVRFYFNNQDVADINGSFPTHDAGFQQLIFYKTKDGNPDPTTNLSGATDITSIFPGSDADQTHWTYSYIGAGSHSAEFLVNSFSGGGGAGVTVNSETLPVKLISFSGRQENNAISLKWTVSSELNVDRYEVEASVDGRTFSNVGKVKPKATSNSTIDYTQTDLNVYTQNAAYYRLAVIDKDGKKSYSEVIKVSILVSSSISLYPVPANNSITVASKSISNKTCIVEVYNSLGVKVMQAAKTASASAVQLNTSALPNGRYKAIIFNDNGKIGEAGFVILR